MTRACTPISVDLTSNEHILSIPCVHPGDAAEIIAEHGRQIREEIRQTLNTKYPPFFFALIYENQQTMRATFILLGRQTVLHRIRVRCHVLGPDKPSTYPYYSRCAVPTHICSLIQTCASVESIIPHLSTLNIL